MLFLMANIWNSNIIKSSLALMLLALPLQIQQQFELLEVIPTDAQLVTTDHFNNIYLIDNRGSLIKLEKGKEPVIYSETRFGNLRYIDATNPLKLLLFYPDYSTIIVLDKNLALLGAHQLQYKNLRDIPAAGLSQDNKIWIYDKSDFKLKKLDDNSEILLQSERLNSLDIDLNPNFILSRNNWVYLNDPVNGIYVFDNYATYYKKIPLTGLQRFQILDDQLVYYKNNELNIFNLKTLEPATVALPDTSGLINISIQKSRLFLVKPNAINVYTY